MSESEIQELRKPVAGEIFYNIFHSRTQIINEIVNEIEIQSDKARRIRNFLAACVGDFFYKCRSHLSHSSKVGGQFH